jgi:serine protease Do
VTKSLSLLHEAIGKKTSSLFLASAPKASNWKREMEMFQRKVLSVSLALGLGLSLAPAVSAQGKDKVSDKVSKLEQAIVTAVAGVSPCFVVIGGGSGVVISEDGYMLTNHHVAGGRAIGDNWRIKLPTGDIYQAKMIGTDPYGDISLLKIKVKKDQKLQFVPFGDSDKCKVGDWVIALGNPWGFAKDSTPTVTVGLISAHNRYRGNYGDAIQTDAPINAGNSGGPLIDINGKLIGINGSITTRHGVKVNSGAGYAISVNQIKRFLPALKKGGVISHGQIKGLNVGNSRAGGDGAVIKGVTKGSTADKAGFKTGDVIHAVAKMPVKNSARFFGAISTFPAATKVSVTVKREGKAQTLAVTLDKASTRSAFPRRRTPTPSRNGYFGAIVKSAEKGVEIQSVSPNSPAAKAKLKTGDIILSINGQTVQKARNFNQLLRAKKSGDTIRILIRRGASEKEFKVKLGNHP